MTARADGKRQRWAMRLGFTAIITSALAFAVVARDAASRQVETVEGLVEPSWSEDFAQARTIRVTTTDGTLTIAREDDGWVLRERANHAVEASALTELHRSFAALRFSGARTSDPANYERLGVADPESGGDGLRLTVLGADDEPLADWIIGARREGGAFMRRPDETQTYAATGDFLDLASPAFWMDLDFLDLSRVDIAETTITPEGGGPAYVLARGAPASSDFVLVQPPGMELITVGAANGPGSAMAELRFLDVRSRLAVTGPSIGVHAARTFDGLIIALELFREGEDAWATVTTSPVDGADVADANALNARTRGWIYELPPYAADRLIRPLSTIARPIGAQPPAEP